MANEVAVREVGGVPAELSVPEVLNQIRKIQELMAQGMHDGEHYGVIPGTGNKATLLKPGAEKLCMMFRLAPSYAHEREREPGNAHLTITSTCTLTHIPTGMVYGTGSGMCSTHESKYAYRKAARACPQCGNVGSVIKGRAEYGGGWLCWQKNGGCGAKFPDGHKPIEEQQTGKVANEDVADQWNTVLKMADKRALVAACLNATAASDIFTQDLEDLGPVTPTVTEDQRDETAANNAKPVNQPPPQQTQTGQPEATGATQAQNPSATPSPRRGRPPKAASASATSGSESDELGIELGISSENAEYVKTETAALGMLTAIAVKQFTGGRTDDPAQMKLTEFNTLNGFLKVRREKMGSQS